MTRSKVIAAQSSVWHHDIAADADAVAVSPLHLPDSDLIQIPGKDMAMQVAYGTGSLVWPHLSHEYLYEHGCIGPYQIQTQSMHPPAA